MATLKQQIAVKKKSKTKKLKAKRSLKHLRQKGLREEKKAFLQYFSNLPIQKLAAEFIGVHENTILNWKKKDKKFCDQIGRARSQWALEKAGKIKRVEWLLERIMKDHFAERKEIDTGIDKRMEEFLDRVSSRLPA